MFLVCCLVCVIVCSLLFVGGGCVPCLLFVVG